MIGIYDVCDLGVNGKKLAARLACELLKEFVDVAVDSDDLHYVDSLVASLLLQAHEEGWHQYHCLNDLRRATGAYLVCPAVIEDSWFKVCDHLDRLAHNRIARQQWGSAARALSLLYGVDTTGEELKARYERPRPPQEELVRRFQQIANQLKN